MLLGLVERFDAPRARGVQLDEDVRASERRGEHARRHHRESGREIRVCDADRYLQHFPELAESLPVAPVHVLDEKEIEAAQGAGHFLRVVLGGEEIELPAEKNLQTITAVNLAGITPAVEKTVTLGEGTDYVDATREIALPLTEEGAYLVMVRGGELSASGLVLITSLELEVGEDARSGRVRVNVLDRRARTYLRAVEVKIVGSDNEKFRSGKTDPRGIFIADGIRGTAAVIARKGKDTYAFHRGQTVLGVAQQAAQAPNAFGIDLGSIPA